MNDATKISDIAQVTRKIDDATVAVNEQLLKLRH